MASRARVRNRQLVQRTCGLSLLKPPEPDVEGFFAGRRMLRPGNGKLAGACNGIAQRYRVGKRRRRRQRDAPQLAPVARGNKLDGRGRLLSNHGRYD